MNLSTDRIFVAGGSGMVGSAIIRRLIAEGFTDILTNYHSRVPDPSLWSPDGTIPRSSSPVSISSDQGSQFLIHDTRLTVFRLDLTDQAAVHDFFKREEPTFAFLAAAKVGGIMANNTYPAQFIRDNLAIQTNVIHSAYTHGVTRLIFLGSSCIYPRDCPQPIKEDYLLTGPLEETNRAYAVAKIAGIEMCRSYNRQYGTRYLAVMPTNLYGPGDNYDLNSSHVIPALIRKFYLAKCLEARDFDAIRADIARSPLRNGHNAGGDLDDDALITLLSSFGIIRLSAAGSASPASSNTAHGSLNLTASVLDSSPLTPGPSRQGEADPVSPSLTVGRGGSATPHRVGVSVVLWGTGNPRREFLHVDDLSAACVFLMERLANSAVANPAGDDIPGLDGSSALLYNVGCGFDLTIRDLALMVKDIVGFRGDVQWDATKPDGTPRKLLDVSRIRGLGWNHTIRLEEGIRQTLASYLGDRSG